MSPVFRMVSAISLMSYAFGILFGTATSAMTFLLILREDLLGLALIPVALISLIVTRWYTRAHYIYHYKMEREPMFRSPPSTPQP